MSTDAASGWLLDELEDGKPAPASALDAIRSERGGFVSLLALGIDACAEKYGEKAVHKDFAIPALLNAFAEENNINFSQVMEDYLKKLHQQAMAKY
jgi:hypothetical protein